MIRIPRKQIVMAFKEGSDIDRLAYWYRHYFPKHDKLAREKAITDIIREYMRKQRAP